MNSYKEMWIDAHDELIAEYLENHPEATEEEAYKMVTGPQIDAKAADALYSKIDLLRMQAKEGGR